jgi:hypothetical protein
MTTYLHTNKMRLVDLRDHIQMHHRWRNSSRSFRGGPISPRDRRWIEEVIWWELPLHVKQVWTFGNPDYVVWSNDCPVLIHCTTTTQDKSWVNPLAETFEMHPALRAHQDLIDLLVPMLNAVEAEEILEWSD